MSFKLTERELAAALKSDASLLITQPEGAAGSEIESLRRIKVSDLLSNLRDMGMLMDADACPVDNASGATVVINDAVKAPVKALTVNLIPAQSGSGDPSAANPRPIAGHTSAMVTHRHKNAANIPDNTYTNSGVTFVVSGGAVRMTGTSTGTINRTIGTAELKGGVTYTISGTRPSGIYDAEALRIDLRNPGGGVIASGDSYFGFTYTPTADITVSINIRVASGQTLDATLYPQVEPGEAVTDFEPYEVNTLPVEWTDEAGTVYGGTLNVLTGELLVDWVLFETTWGAGTSARAVGTTITRKTFALPAMSKSSGQSGDSVCNLCSYAVGNSETEHYYIMWQQSGSSFVANATVYLPNGTADDQAVQIAYRTQKPMAVYRLDAPAAQVVTSQGSNIFEADAGEVAVAYRADPTQYIARKIVEARNS